MRAGDEDIVEGMANGAFGVVPSGVSYPACAPVPVGITIGFRGVVVVSGFRGPRAVDFGVERPVGDVDADDCIDEAAAFECVGARWFKS